MNKQIITAIPIQEFEEIIAKVVEDRVRSIINQETEEAKDTNQPYATRKEISKKLRISLPTLNTLTKTGVLKAHRIGRRVLYKWDEVEEVLEEVSSNKYRRKSLL